MKRHLPIIAGILLLSASALHAQNPCPSPDKVQICHKGKVVICVSQNAVQAHLAHGDHIGSCSIPPPCTVTANGGSITCAHPSVTLTAVSGNTGVSYLWTGPNGFSSTAANPVVTVAGIYSVTVSSSSCTGVTDTALVSTNKTAPVVTTTGGTISCNNASVKLTASSNISGSSFSWTGPNGFTSNVASPTVTAAGSYVVTVTNPATGCSATNAAVVQQNLNAPAILTIQASNSGTIDCRNPSLVLTATTNATDVTYKWTGPNNFISNEAMPQVTQPGTYHLNLSNNGNGCSSNASVEVMQNTTAPVDVNTIPAVLGTLTCSQSSLVLTGGSSTAGVSYNWTGPNGFNSTSRVTTATVPGVYQLTVTDPTNGCGSNASVRVEQNVTTPAGVTASNSEALTCFTTEVSIMGSSSTEAVSYSWSGPGGFTSTSPVATTSVGGNYTLTVTDLQNGCTSSASTTVEQHTTPPADVTANRSGILSCANTSVTLQASSTTVEVDYNWFGPDGFYAPTAETSTGTPGEYVLMVTDRQNGCSVMETVLVEQDLSDCGTNKKAAQSELMQMETKSVELSTYPNPVHSKGSIAFTIPQQAKVNVVIYNANGAREQVLFNQNALANHKYLLSLDTSKFGKGIYYCVMTVDNKQYSKTLVVQ